MASEPAVSVITTNLNGREDLPAFLESLGSQTLRDFELIVVDNASVDGSLALVQQRFPRATIISNDRNLGFAKANNQGAAAARGRYLALLNNDTRLEPNWVEMMVNAIKRASPDTVCIASRMLSWDGTVVDFIGGTMSFNGIAEHLAFGAPSDSDAARAYPHELLFASGAAMLIDREVYLDVGGFDDDYFAYYEDVDLGWRLWILGFRVAFCPDAVVYHRRNVSLPASDQTTFLLERNALFSMLKNYDDDSLAALLPAALLLATRRAAARSGLTRGEFELADADGRPGIRSLPAKAGIRVLRALKKWSPDEVCVVRRDAYATMAALDAVVAELPRLFEKRRVIQAARTRPDAEIAHLFRTPYGSGRSVHEAGRDDPEVAVLRALGVVDYFEALLRRSIPA